MYDHDPEEVESLGWEEFIARQWESIFTGYRSWTGLAPEVLAALLERHAKFLSFIRLCAFGPEDGEDPAR